MGIKSSVIAALALLIVESRPAVAEQPSSGTYQVTFQQLTNSCSGETMLSMDKGVVALTVNDDAIRITVPQLPTMSGTIRAGGKLKTEAVRQSGARPDARYSASGRADGNRIQLVIVADYYKGDKPLCTQSWDASGSRR